METLREGLGENGILVSSNVSGMELSTDQAVCSQNKVQAGFQEDTSGE